MITRTKLTCLMLAPLALLASCSDAGTPVKDTNTQAATQAKTGDAKDTKTGSSNKTVTIKDHWGRDVEVPVNPQKVVIMEWEGVASFST